MSIFKCKMCGGTIEFEPGATVGVCDSCGTKQTLPRLDDERRASLYDRANHFRRNNEFDKAAGLYDQILNEDSTDAEAYWSLVLCRYGIEYVEDPSTHKRVPTVNRTQFTSIFDDEDYKSALEHADGYQRRIYEEEAREINEIQKGILAISQKEQPFDVFICYKEADNNGRRTQDSVLANDLYHQLTQEGFRVFFSRITLEDKLGTAYEPYIFAALNSAKVMVVLGTKPEYFNAVWVKNEWSRYLALVRESKGQKVLIPAYRDMDPYDLPEEFSHLMAQDMSKLGFMQDLIRGIKKIVRTNEPKQTAMETVVVTGGSANASSLLKRAFLFLEDGDWDSADDYCEKVLDIDPENARAYLGKLMAEEMASKEEDLADCAQPFDDNSNYQKAIRFGDEKLRKQLQGYLDHINKRNENDRLTGIYERASARMGSAGTEADFKAAAEVFRSISGFQDAEEQADLCTEKAEICRKNKIYDEACALMNGDDAQKCEQAIEKFRTISGWKDADNKIYSCQTRINEIRTKEESDRLERERKRIQKEKKEKEQRAKRKTGITIGIIAAIVAVIAIFVVTKVIISNNHYNQAVALLNADKYEEAITIFEALNSYKDSNRQITSAKEKIKERDYAAAVAKYGQEYVDSFNELGIGDTCKFGSYEQDNNTLNGKEEIEWIVLAKENMSLLLISKYALDCQPYNSRYSHVTWETCTLRTWLNNDFLNAAFNSTEKEMIPIVTVTADKNPSYDTKPGNNTKDQVFLLSILEANKYFNSSDARMCGLTDYAIAQGAVASRSYKVDGKTTCSWWLRSPGEADVFDVCVSYDGHVDDYGDHVYAPYHAVRPALWIDLAS